MLTVNFAPFPVLETQRLVLRRLNEEDADKIFELRSDAETMKYVPRPLAKTREDALQHLANIDEKLRENTGINWAITLKGNPEFIGIIGHYKIEPDNFRAELGYMLLPAFHGKGIVTEAIRATLIYGFDVMKLHSVEAIIDPGNIASEAVLIKNGFVKEAHLRENGFWDGKFLDTVIYCLLAREFRR